MISSQPSKRLSDASRSIRTLSPRHTESWSARASSARVRGLGTFIVATLGDASLAAQGPLRTKLRRWLIEAHEAGLDQESIDALFHDTSRALAEEEIA